MSIQVIEIIKEMPIDVSELYRLNRAIEELKARGYFEKKEQFADLVGWPKDTFNKRISNDGSANMLTHHFQECWNAIEKTDPEVFEFWEKVRRGKL